MLLNTIHKGIEAMNTAESRHSIIIIRSAKINSNTSTIKDGGHGTLAISHAIISAHERQLSIEDLSEGGACVQFTLPKKHINSEN